MKFRTIPNFHLTDLSLYRMIVLLGHRAFVLRARTPSLHQRVVLHDKGPGGVLPPRDVILAHEIVAQRRSVSKAQQSVRLLERHLFDEIERPVLRAQQHAHMPDKQQTQSVPGRLDTAHSRAISARRSVFRVFSDIPLSCCLFSFILFFILSHHSGNGNSVLRFFSCSIPLCELYVNRLHTIFFNKFPASSLSFLLFFCLSFTAGQKKTPRFLFSAEFSFRFCFTPNRAPQGSPAWSSHSAPSLPFFSGRYTQWKAPTFPQSADGSS